MLIFYDNFFTITEIANYDIINQSNTTYRNLSIRKFFNYPHIFIIILIIIYLLITLIAIVKITKSKSGPFRQIHP